MYRLLEDSGQPTKKQAPGKSIRPFHGSGPEKREDRPGEPAIGTGKYPGHDLLGGQ